jgi:RNA polymerase sigma-70 factor (ECF subfamily)
VPARTIAYCVVPLDLAPKLHETLRRHFAADPATEVVVEARVRERRAGADRRTGADAAGDLGRRWVRAHGGRRLADRRASLIEVDAPSLPRKARAFAARLRFVERLEPGDRQLEDLDTARLITRIQAGDRELFSVVYLRHFDRVYGYVRNALRDSRDAEDLTQQVFIAAFERIHSYEVRVDSPFRAWLVAVARHKVLNHRRKHGRVEVEDPERLARRLDGAQDPDPDQARDEVLGWLSDRELAVFIERLPSAQREVLTLRFLFDLSTEQIARTLRRTPDSVRQLQHRALATLRARLAAVGRPVRGTRRAPVRVVGRQRPVIRSRRFALAATPLALRRHR